MIFVSDELRTRDPGDIAKAHIKLPKHTYNSVDLFSKVYSQMALDKALCLFIVLSKARYVPRAKDLFTRNPLQVVLEHCMEATVKTHDQPSFLRRIPSPEQDRQEHM